MDTAEYRGYAGSRHTLQTSSWPLLTATYIRVIVRYLMTLSQLQRLYDGVSKSFRTGRLERELRMVQLSATRCSCIAIL
jgi:hypothetical protein